MMDEKKCWLCGNNAEVRCYPNGEDNNLIDCSVCGKYARNRKTT